MIRAVLPGLLLAGILSPFGGTAYRRNDEGNRRYEEGALDEALRAYTEAQVAAPESLELHYNIGNVLYRQGDFRGAAEAYTRALLSAPESLAPDAAFNLGNALFREEDFRDAVKAYRRTLEGRPEDLDAKHNLELALRAMAQQEKPESQKDQPPQENPNEKEDRPQPGSSEPRESPDRSDEAQSPTAPQSGERQEEAGSEGGMTRQEAERLLDRLAEQEKDNLRNKALRRIPSEGKPPEKDW